MKLAFSTLACPDWSFSEVLSTAKDFGFDGIEVRGIKNEIFAPRIKAFLKENINETIQRLSDLKLEIPMLTSECVLGNCNDKVLENAKAYISLAGMLKVPFVRMLVEPGASPDSSLNINLSQVADTIHSLLPDAKSNNVKILIETNGILADSKTCLSFIEPLASDNLGILWDIHHPYRYFNEDVSGTYERLKPYINYIHIKDSELVNGTISYKLMGYGDMPNEKAINLLAEDNYNGYVSLEWVRRWNRQMEEPGLVLPHYLSYMRKVLKK